MKHITPELMKFKRLQRRLGTTLRETIGTLELLWIGTAKNTPDGGIGRLSDVDIAILCDWPDDPDLLMSALICEGWIDEAACESNRLVIHDWSQHCPNYIKGALAKHGQQPALAACSSNLPKQPALATCSGHPATRPDQTRPDQTKPKDGGGFNPLEVDLPYGDRFQAAWKDWVQHRKEKNSRLTKTSVGRQLKKLAEMSSEEQAIGTIENTIEKGWLGLQEPITNGRGEVDMRGPF